MTPRRTTKISLALALGSTLGVAACGGGTLGSTSEEEATGPVKIGLLVPQSGVYKSLGDDMKAGFEVYLKEKGNKLGGKEVQVVTADEGETADSGKAAADKLVKQDKARADELMQKAADAGNPLAAFNWAQILVSKKPGEEGLRNALPYYEKSAAKGIADAEYALSQIYLNLPDLPKEKRDSA